MKRTRLLLATLVTAMCVLFGFAAAACSNNNEPKTYTVTFDVQGHGVAPAAITDIEEGAKIEKPTDPVAEDYVFGGWFKDKTCEYEWKFDVDTVTSTRVLYAKWTAETYTVSFDLQEHGAAITAQDGLVKGAKVTEPTAPTEEGYVFAGWYKEAACSNKWDFASDTVSADTTLYARWKEVYVVETQTPASFRVEDENYFTVPVTGTYIFRFVNEDAQADRFKLDGESEEQLIGGSTAKYLLEKGRYTIDTLGAAFEVTVRLSEVDLPFTQLHTYYGETYELTVMSLGIDSMTEVKNNVVMVRFGLIGSAEYMTVDDFDGEYYYLSSASCHLKLAISGNETADNVSLKAYAAFEDDLGNWEYPTDLSDTLTRAKNATEIVQDLQVTAQGAVNTAEVENSFEYVYFDVSDYMGQWLEFTNFAAGMEFRWVNLELGREGDLADVISIEADYPIRLESDYYTCIAVRPASGSTVTFTVKTSAAPKGLSEDDPIVMTGNSYSLRNPNASGMNSVRYYIQFNTDDTGFYNISFTYTTGTSTAVYKTTYFEVNGAQFGYDSWSFTWYGGLSNDNPVARVELQATNMIMVELSNGSANYTLSVEKEAEKAHGTLVTGVFKGTDTSNVTHMLNVNYDTTTVTYTRVFNNVKSEIGTVTYTGANGVYAFIANNKEYTFEVNENGTLEFDSKDNGIVTLYSFDVAAEANLAGRYIAEVIDGDDSSYNVILDISGNADTGFTADYYCSEWEMSEENRPIGFADGKYTFKYWYNQETALITINASGSLTISGFNPYASRADWTEFTKTDEYPLALAAKTYAYSDGTTSYTMNIAFYYGVYTVSFNGQYASTLAYANGKYTATVWMSQDTRATVSITKKSDTVLLVEGFNGAGSSADFEEKQGGSEGGGDEGETKALTEGTYTSGSWKIELVKNGDSFTGTYQDTSSMLNAIDITLVASNGGYTFTWADSWGTNTSTITVVSESEITIGNYSGYSNSATFTKIER